MLISDNWYLYPKNIFTSKSTCRCKTQVSHTSKTATGKPFAQQWILGSCRILTLVLTLPSVGSKLGGIGFTMPSWQAMFYGGHRASLHSENKHYGSLSILLICISCSPLTLRLSNASLLALHGFWIVKLINLFYFCIFNNKYIEMPFKYIKIMFE